MNSLIGYSGRHYMDSIGSGISANSDSYKGEQEFLTLKVPTLTKK